MEEACGGYEGDKEEAGGGNCEDGGREGCQAAVSAAGLADVDLGKIAWPVDDAATVVAGARPCGEVG